MKLLRIILAPFSLLYSGVIFLRNRAYDWGWLTSEKGPVPTIVVGNVTVGGTGKTPFTVLLLNLLKQKKLAFLSRGYGRKSKGYVKVEDQVSAQLVGDEPLLVCLRAKPMAAAVCENRIEGLAKLKLSHPSIEAVVLDDAMQHRRLNPDVLVMLTTYQNPFYDDNMLPFGNLRDNRREARRAQAIVVTKCPTDLRKSEQNAISNKIHQYSEAPIFFTSIRYGTPVPLINSPTELAQGADLLVATGIASPDVFVDELKKGYSVKKVKVFSDHHDFSNEDVRLLMQEFDSIVSDNKAIFVTEKDAVKLKQFDALKNFPCFYVPIDFYFLDNQSAFLNLLENAIN
jgi:tetraacyldisaccharide 4'-kinase